MCGIVGVFAYRSATRVDCEELRMIRDHMAIRGPDSSGEWFAENGSVGLGHRRLSIVDLSDRATQPMVSEDGQLVISFNGEIYNYRELKKNLEAKGRIFRTESDTEVLLHLYAEKGEAMLAELRGMFAFALWDARQQAMLLARDPFGIKPLYYADDGRTFRFASQVKALLAGGQIDTEPEPAGHAGFFLWGSVPEPWTLYRGVRNLPSGHFLRVTRAAVDQPRPYCVIADILRDAKDHPAAGSSAEALEIFADAFRDSIRAHQIADVPVGIFLSAGLDSAIIATIATADGNRPHSMTLAFAEYAGTESDEAPMAEILAAKLGTKHTTVMVRRDDFADDKEALLAAMDQPSIDGVNTWFVSRAAAELGIKVALSGLGGDELLASYSTFRELPRVTSLLRYFNRLPDTGRILRSFLAPFISRVSSPKYAGIVEYGGSLGGAYLLRRGLYMPWELPTVLDPDLANQGLRDLNTVDALNTTVSKFGNNPGQSRLAVSALEMSWYMRHQLLRDTDWAGMAHSMEVRVPFLDIRLLRAAASCFALHPSISKPQVAMQMAQDLPTKLISKPKTGFSVPVKNWLTPDQGAYSEHGMRGWARYVYDRFDSGTNAVVRMAGRK